MGSGAWFAARCAEAGVPLQAVWLRVANRSTTAIARLLRSGVDVVALSALSEDEALLVLPSLDSLIPLAHRRDGWRRAE